MNIEFVNILDVDEDLIEQVRKWRNSKNVSKYMYTNHYIDKEEHQRWIKKLKTQKNAKTWIIKYENKPIGLVSLSDIDYKNKTTDWGFYIADESIRGKGIGTIALQKLISIVFDEMKLNKMHTIVFNNNIVAMKLYEKLGFKKVGKRQEKIVRNGEIIELINMEISKRNWKKKKINDREN